MDDWDVETAKLLSRAKAVRELAEAHEKLTVAQGEEAAEVIQFPSLKAIEGGLG